MAIGEFRYRRRVQYRDTDASGIVHFSAFFVFGEEAEHAMWRQVGLTVEEQGSEIGWPRLAASFDFLRALRFEDDVDVEIRVIGKTSKTFSYQVVITHENRIAAVGTMSTICVRKRPGEPLRAMDIPPDISACFTIVAPIDVPVRRPLPTPHSPIPNPRARLSR